ncbi:MAG: hypothetical protein JXR64_13620 [Spirochaetales bacterium]|nr:hypothetical protein [Spirochaetales bacterium]
MKKFSLLVLFTLGINIYSQDNVISLKNKAESKNVPITKKDDSIRNNIHLPKSVYIGDLGSNRYSDSDSILIFNTVDSFISSLKTNSITNIDADFKFIFQSLYIDLLDKNRALVSWNIGNPVIENEYSQVKIELNYRDNLYIGNIYLDLLNEKWLVTGLQIEKEERGVFDPSSPNVFNRY